MVFVDGGNDKIGIATNSPAAAFDIQTSWGLKWREVTDDYTIVATDNVVSVKDTTGWDEITVTLPAVAGNTGRVITVKADSGTNAQVTLDGNSSETIDGQSTKSLGGAGTAVTVICDGTEWHVINAYAGL